jgi:hypothetical protein
MWPRSSQKGPRKGGKQQERAAQLNQRQRGVGKVGRKRHSKKVLRDGTGREKETKSEREEAGKEKGAFFEDVRTFSLIIVKRLDGKIYFSSEDESRDNQNMRKNKTRPKRGRKT